MVADNATALASLHGRVAIITGAGKGLGRAYALALAARGAHVVVNNRRHPGEQDSETSAQQTVDAIRAAGGTVIANFDAADADGAGGRMVQQAVDHFGRIDIVIANAALSQASTFGKQSLDDFMRIFNVGFLGTLNLVHAAWPLLRAQRHGRVIATTSSAGRYGNHGLGAYAASKGAIEMLVRSLAAEGASAGIRVNAISPYAATQMTAGHLGPDVAACLTPDVVAPMVAWLSSDACSANGQVFIAGGGRFRRGFSVETDSVAGSDMEQVAQALADMPGRPHPSSNHAFATLVDELRAGGQIP
ncbi:MAG TPA: short-chain dehydrogenase [Acidimicrobiaceae bacterium]|nr:short-chain dehydrogenase [Acidimicrobiaceae bacterium]